MKGVHCYKKEVTDMQTTVTFYKDGEPLVTHIIKPRSECGNFIQLRWLDNNGQYRFFSFIESRKESFEVKEIGSLSIFNISLVGALGASKVITKDVTKKVTLYQTNVTPEERQILAGLYTSIDVSMSYGFTDVWQRVETKGDANFIIPKNNRLSNIELVVTLAQNSLSL